MMVFERKDSIGYSLWSRLHIRLNVSEDRITVLLVLFCKVEFAEDTGMLTLIGVYSMELLTERELVSIPK